MPDKLKEFFDKRKKELDELIEAQEEANKEGFCIPYEHYWGRRAELMLIRNKVDELLKEVYDEKN